MAEHLDFDNPAAQITRKGKLYRVTVDVYVPEVAANADHLEEWLKGEMGGGTIKDSNPLVHHSLQLHQLVDIKDMKARIFTVWEAQNSRDDGKRYGHSIAIRDGEPEPQLQMEQPATTK